MNVGLWFRGCLNSKLGDSKNHIHVPTPLTTGEVQQCALLGGWVGPTADLDVLEKWKVSASAWNRRVISWTSKP
jgi:hypothetical protein